MKKIVTGPAPKLTKVQFDAIRGDADADWQYLWGAPSTKAPCTGKTLYVAVYFLDYPNKDTVQFFDNGSSINSEVTWYINMEELISGPDKIVYAFREYYSIPFSVLQNHSELYVQASGINGGSASAALLNLQLASTTLTDLTLSYPSPIKTQE
jgi:hypothetical protein